MTDAEMTRPKLYTDQLVVLVRRPIRERIDKIKAQYGLTQAEVIRRAIDHGLPLVEADTARQAAADAQALAS